MGRGGDLDAAVVAPVGARRIAPTAVLAVERNHPAQVGNQLILANHAVRVGVRFAGQSRHEGVGEPARGAVRESHRRRPVLARRGEDDRARPLEIADEAARVARVQDDDLASRKAGQDHPELVVRDVFLVRAAGIPHHERLVVIIRLIHGWHIGLVFAAAVPREVEEKDVPGPESLPDGGKLPKHPGAGRLGIGQYDGMRGSKPEIAVETLEDPRQPNGVRGTERELVHVLVTGYPDEDRVHGSPARKRGGGGLARNSISASQRRSHDRKPRHDP